jgi:hypothetical protein
MDQAQQETLPVKTEGIFLLKRIPVKTEETLKVKILAHEEIQCYLSLVALDFLLTLMFIMG